MFHLSRRSFLRYCGAGASTLASGCLLPMGRHREREFSSSPVSSVFSDWIDVPYPILLPGDQRSAAPANFRVLDELVLPDRYSYSVIAQWGDRFGPEGRDIRFGSNCDFVGLIPVRETDSEFWLVVNHEYVSARPWSDAFQSEFGKPPPAISVIPDPKPKREGSGVLSIAGYIWNSAEIDLSDPQVRKMLPETAFAELDELGKRILEEVGVSIVHVKRSSEGLYSVILHSPHHKRITALSSTNIARGCGISFSGPGAAFFPPPPGTLANCSGAVTPWGTMLTCEENIQDFVVDGVTADGQPLSPSTVPFSASMIHSVSKYPLQWEGIHQAYARPLDGRAFGWVCEVAPETGALIKHSALGRFRHENVALRVEPGRRLLAYMGDDRRGGHIWRYRSRGIVGDPSDPSNSRLFEDGELAVAKFHEDFTGEWIPLTAETPLEAPRPDRCSTGHQLLPKRPEGGSEIVTSPGKKYEGVSVAEWIAAIEKFGRKPYSNLVLGDLVLAPQTLSKKERSEFVEAVLLLDAFLMANAIGGTPTARPEGIDIHPFDRSVYIAFTDSTGRSEGSPDMRIFPDSLEANSRQYGAIYRIEEIENLLDGSKFRWGRFVSSGEVAESGGGFAAADNIRFDRTGNLWMVCDISAEALQHEVTRSPGTTPGEKSFAGIFGNNAIFCIPTTGPEAGLPRCFGIGPMESELTGFEWIEDERSFLLSVQHPGEFCGIRGARNSQLALEEERTFILANPDGSSMPQVRVIPLGSNFPSGRLGEIPRSSVVQIYRKNL